MQISSEWQPTIEAILADPGIVVVIGATDTGKTTFCLLLLNASAALNVPADFVDSDIGQSVVGPPGTIGLATAETQVDSFDELKHRKLYFIGATTPVGHLLPTVVGVKRLVEVAQASGDRLIVVDTTGMVRGTIARRLKTFKVDALQPRHIVGIQKSNEIEHLLALFRNNRGVMIHRLSPTPQVKKKPQEYRASRRRSLFYEAFHNAQGHIIHLDQIVCRNTFFGTGNRMPWRHVKTIEEFLGVRVLHAESVGRGIYAVTETQPSSAGQSLVMEHYNTREVSIVPAQAFKNVILGLSDSSGLCMDVGLLHAIDFKQRYMFVLSRIKTITPVRIVQFGSMRVRSDGTELGRVEPGEI